MLACVSVLPCGYDVVTCRAHPRGGQEQLSDQPKGHTRGADRPRTGPAGDGLASYAAQYGQNDQGQQRVERGPLGEVVVDFRIVGHSQSGLIQDRAHRSGAQFLIVRSGKGSSPEPSPRDSSATDTAVRLLPADASYAAGFSIAAGAGVGATVSFGCGPVTVCLDFSKTECRGSLAS